MRRIVLALPETGEEVGRFALYVRNKDKRKPIAWVWLERMENGDRRPNASVLAVRVRGNAGKEMLIASDPEKFFTEPHYNNSPAVLVRLDAISIEELEELLTDAWEIQAPRALVKSHFGSGSR